MAFNVGSKISKCRMVAGLERLISALRPNDRPVSAAPPKVK